VSPEEQRPPRTRRSARSTAPVVAEKLAALLRELRQGDLISLGAVTLVGKGPAAATAAAKAVPAPDELWSVTVESDVGWYAIVSGPCDIERRPEVEPCLAISPVRLVTPQRYQELRSGSYSPREFPLPAGKLAHACRVPEAGAFCPVVDVRYITSLDKTALLHPDVATLRPLTGPQKKRFGLWIGHRFARPAHPGEIEDNVLGRLGRIVRRLAGEYQRNEPKQRSVEARLVGAATEWLITPSDRLVEITVIVSEPTCREAGFFNTKAGEIDESGVEGATKRLATALRSALPRGVGYVVRVLARTLDGMTAADYLALEPWSWADDDDPLSDDDI